MRFKDMFNKLDIYQKRLFMQAIVKNITVYNKDKIRLSLALPSGPQKAVAQNEVFKIKQPDFYPFYAEWGG